MKRNATLRQVALRAGVSTATASRVVNGSAVVRPETRARVERAMHELLYVTPGRSTTGAIGLLVPELGNPIFPALAQAMEARATAAGLVSILCNTGGSPEREASYVYMLIGHDVDGMIFISSEAADLASDHSHYRRLLADGARLVFVNGCVPELGAPSVGVDETAAGRVATQHLVELGHRRIGFVAGPARFAPTRDKAAGRRQALEAAGLPAAEELVVHGDFSVAGGSAAAARLLALGKRRRPTAVICSSDLVAIGTLRAAEEAGLAVPEDLSVVGFDGIDATAWTQPRLTTVVQPIDDIAEQAVDALRTLITEPGRRLPGFVFTPSLRPGGSTAPPRAPRARPRATRPPRPPSS